MNPFISRKSFLCKNDILKFNVFSSISKVLLSHGSKTFHKMHKILMPSVNIQLSLSDEVMTT